MWDYGTQSPKYLSAAIGITVTPALFALMVSHGITRRMFAVAAGIFLVGAAVCTALIWVLAYQVEHVIYDWAGLTQTLANPHLGSVSGRVSRCCRSACCRLPPRSSGWSPSGSLTPPHASASPDSHVNCL
ncbi:hypothetical protein EV644_1362 [Kribbella orskensis]|uniref:Uncharacterized protein n=1 Tax=Kribbella orskensis TaxID=2512216 RepID=A0ABY2B7L5_9ACTN|nr:MULTISPECIES: hypothetical protein [Kribbella]TCN30008.1 hypothetical protein EV642_13849 [Kribbella sp. VKM Ac-2500]TCO10080.1 hypothetical protein EV644_1362 [Kribbella orskensis]